MSRDKEHLSTAVNGPRKVVNSVVIDRCVDCSHYQMSECEVARLWQWKVSGPIPTDCPLPSLQ